MPKKEPSTYKTAAAFLQRTINPHRKWYYGASLIALILVGAGLTQARITQSLIDSATLGDLQPMLGSLVMYLALIGANLALQYLSGVCVSQLAAHAGRDLKRTIAGVLLRAQYGETIKLQAGDTLQTVNTDTQAVCAFLGGDLIGLFSQFTMALGALSYLLVYNPLLALVTFAYTPIGMFFTLTLNRKMNALYPKCADGEGRALSVVEQILMQIPVVKSFAMETAMRQKVHGQYSAVRDTEMRIAVPNALLQSACSSAAQIPKLLYLIFAGYMVLRGHMTIGALIAMFDLLLYIIGPSVYFPFMLNSLNRAAASMGRVARLERLPQERETSESPADTSDPMISIDRCTFWHTGDKPVISDLSFAHRGCGVIAVCGRSGGGKTTLLDLLAGLYVPRAGRINVCGDVSVLSQETFLFADTLCSNVRLARPAAGDHEVLSALALAGAEGFVSGLPQGVHTPVGDGNMDLSGGQRQRVALARLLLADRPIWLLDEPTSALDAETEQVVLAVIRRMAARKLIVVCAHRQSLIEIADRRIDL